MPPMETAHTCDAEALYAVLPSFLAPGAQEDDDGDELADATPGFEPLVLPLRPGCAPWRIASDGRLAAAHGDVLQD